MNGLFESRNGEAILVRGVDNAPNPVARGAFPNPRLVAMHHPQFF